MHVRLVTPSKTVAIVLKGVRWNWRITEPRMPFCIGRSASLNIMPRRCEAIVITLAGDVGKIWRWRRLGIDRSGMRTSSQKERQQQRQQGKPFLHFTSSIVGFDVPP